MTSKIFFSKASLPYLSTSALSFGAWFRQAGPPMQPFIQAIPSIKLASSIPLFFLRSAKLHCSMPLHTSAFNVTFSFPVSISPSLTASARPPLLAKIRPKYEASLSIVSSNFDKSKSLAANIASSSSNVITASTYSPALVSLTSIF